MEEFVTKFVNLQRYVPYSRDEKTKVCIFITCLPSSYKEKIEFDMPKNMDEEIRKDKWCYHLLKQRLGLSKNCQSKKNEKMDQCRKGFKPSHFIKGTRSQTDNNYNRTCSINNNGTKVIRNFNSRGSNYTK